MESGTTLARCVAGPVHGVADLVEPVFGEVAVGVEGHRRRAVSQHLLDDLDVGAARDGQTRGRVPERGTLYRMPVAGGTSLEQPLALFRSQNRYRDTAISPDGRTIYVATDSTGLVEGPDGSPTTVLTNRGAILAFTYTP